MTFLILVTACARSSDLYTIIMVQIKGFETTKQGENVGNILMTFLI